MDFFSCHSCHENLSFSFFYFLSKFRFYKLFRRDSLVFVKCFDKVTFVIKTAGDGGFLDGNILCGQHLTGAFDSIIIQIINWRAFRHAAEIAAEIFGIHSGNLGQTVKTDAIIIILGDIGKHIFNGIQVSCGLRILYIFFIKMLFQNCADELIQAALRHKFITGPPAGQGEAEIVHDGPDCRADLGKKCMYGDLVVHDIVDMFGACMVILHQNLKVKNNAVIDAGLVLRVAAMQRAVRNENNVAFVAGADIIVQGHMKIAGENADDLVVTVPVIWHVIARAMGRLVIKGDREIEGALLPLLFIIKIFHCPAYFLSEYKQVNIVVFFYIISLFFFCASPYNKK